MENKDLFRKYCSIENSYREQYISKIKAHPSINKSTIFNVKEKIHGSSAVISVVSGNGVKCKELKVGKRSGWLEENESFYNLKNIAKTLEKDLFNMFDYINFTYVDKDKDFEILTVYGEVFGGNYTHPDVQRNKTASKVQKGVQYTPENKFLAFDIAVNGKYVTNSTFDSLCFQFHIPYIETLFEGTLDECLSYPNEFQTTIPNYYSLPIIENNICEGVVIKPNEPTYFADSRIIIKNKNDKFKEVEMVKTERKEIQLSEEAQKDLESILSYATENRLLNVISKIGEVTMSDFGRIMKDFNLDILEDFTKDVGFNTIEESEIKIIKKQLNNKVSTLVKEYMYNNA